LLLYGQRIDTHLTDPPLGTDRGFPLVFDHRTKYCLLQHKGSYYNNFSH